MPVRLKDDQFITTAPTSIKDLGAIDEVWQSTKLGLPIEANRNTVALVSSKFVYPSQGQDRKVVFLLIADAYAEKLEESGEGREIFNCARNAIRKQHSYARVITIHVASDLVLNALANVVADRQEEQRKNDLEKEIDDLLWHCFKVDASDIHIECGDHENRIMIRRDGELMPYGVVDRNIDKLHTLVSVMYASLAAQDGETKGVGFESRDKLDGSLFREINGKRLGARIVSHSTNKKEKNFVMVLRCTGDQNQDAKRIPFDDLGFVFNQIDKIRKATNGKGISLLIGETNSGKSVTLENILLEINEVSKGTKNIIAVENPIERNIRGVKQFTLIKAGVSNPEEMTIAVQDLMSFIVRADPDDISIGEINNEETCETALQSSLTGHNVMATLHCDSPFDVFERLEGFGANSNVLKTGEVLKLAVAQKLFKKLCPHCATTINNVSAITDEHFVSIESLSKMGLGHWVPQVKFRNPQGCEQCDHRGIKGRQLVVEIVEFTPTILKLLEQNEKQEARRQWLRDGNFTRHDVALVYMKLGLVDPTEVIRQFKGFTESFEMRQAHNIKHPEVVYSL